MVYGAADRTLSPPVKHSFLIRAGWTAAATAVVVLLLKTFVGDVYHVDSGSMEPTLWGEEGGGEWVFVRFDRSAPARYDLVVIRRAGEDTPIVKRAVGLPGESLKIVQGDVLIDRQRLRPSEARPPEVVVFDDRWHEVEDRFVMLDTQSRLWTKAGDEWRLDAHSVPRGQDQALLAWRDPLDDGYLGPAHELVRGQTQANDARISCEVRFDDIGGQVRLRLTELADRFEAVLARVDATTAEVAITRRATTDSKSSTAAAETLATARFPLVSGSWTHFWFENRDNALKVGFDGPGSPLVAVYKENTPLSTDGALAVDHGQRAAFGGEDGRFAFRSIRFARDLVYTDQGRIGVQTEVQLGPGQFFLLGDNSSRSRDSREWGPVGAREIVGRPVSVVWPPSRWRRLTGTAAAAVE